MFIKQFRIKSNTAVKNSERRKFRAAISTAFPSLIDGELNQMLPNKGEMSIVKLTTHSGSNVTVYCLSKNPIFFELSDNTLLPTVYTLWQFPEMVPQYTTWPPVFEKLTQGADLMMPGIIVPDEGLPSVSRGTVCAINLAGNSAAVAIGRALLSTSAMIKAGMKGKGIEVFHLYLDQLWDLGEKTPLPTIRKDTAEASQSSEIPVENNSLTYNTKPEQVSDRMKEQMVLDVSDDGDSLHLQKEASMLPLSAKEENLSRVVNEEPEADQNSASGAPLSMDEILFNSFLHAIKYKVKKGDLPLLTSAFYRNHLLPCCPQNSSLDLKKTRYKKLSKFLGEMEKEGIIQVKEQSKGVDCIAAINKGHPSVKGFLPNESNLAEDINAPSEDLEGKQPPYIPPEITELYGVSAKMLVIMQQQGYSKGQWLTSAQVRSVITAYVKDEELNRGSQVTPNGPLSDALLNKNEVAKTHMNWDEIFTRSLNSMLEGYRINFPDHSNLKPAIIKKGKLQPINLQVERRTANKKVTLIHNLEAYGIEPEKVAHEVQVGVAASASVGLSPNNSTHVLVQGNQISFVGHLLLDKYGIPKKYVTGLEKAPKAKRK